MRGIEELERTTVVLDDLELLDRNLVECCTDEPLPQLPWRMTSNVRFSNPLERKT